MKNLNTGLLRTYTVAGLIYYVTFLFDKINNNKYTHNVCHYECKGTCTVHYTLYKKTSTTYLTNLVIHMSTFVYIHSIIKYDST